MRRRKDLVKAKLSKAMRKDWLDISE